MPATDEITHYQGQPIHLGGMEHEIAHTPQGPIDPALLDVYVKAKTASIISVFPRAMRVDLPYSGRLALILPQSRKDRIVIRAMEPRVMARPIQEQGIPEFRDTVRDCPRGEGYSVLTVTDTFQWILDITVADRHNFIPRAISAREVAEALVDGWIRGLATQTSQAGIGLYRPEDGTMEEQAARLRQRQEIAFVEKIRQADLAHSTNRLNEVTDFHRLAAEWMGVERPWFKPIYETITKSCPKCAERVPSQALGCRHCQVDFPDWYTKYRLDTKTLKLDDPAVYEFMVKAGRIKEKSDDPVAKA